MSFILACPPDSFPGSRLNSAMDVDASSDDEGSAIAVESSRSSNCSHGDSSPRSPVRLRRQPRFRSVGLDRHPAFMYCTCCARDCCCGHAVCYRLASGASPEQDGPGGNARFSVVVDYGSIACAIGGTVRRVPERVERDSRAWLRVSSA